MIADFCVCMEYTPDISNVSANENTSKSSKTSFCQGQVMWVQFQNSEPADICVRKRVASVFIVFLSHNFDIMMIAQATMHA